MGHSARKPVFRASEQVRLNPVSSATVTSGKIESLHGASVTPIHSRLRITGAYQAAQMQIGRIIVTSSLREQSVGVVSVKYISLINGFGTAY